MKLVLPPLSLFGLVCVAACAHPSKNENNGLDITLQHLARERIRDRLLPVCPVPSTVRRAKVLRCIEFAHRKLNPVVHRSPPPMQAATRQLLDDFFKRELAGLNDLLERDVMSTWFGRESLG